MSIQTVIVIGAGGAVGTLLVNALLAANFTVSVVARPASRAEFPASVTVHYANYTDLDALTTAFTGQDAVVSAMGTFSAPLQEIPIHAAAAAGVQRFIPSEYGGDTSRAEQVAFAQFPPQKKAIVELLKSKEASGMSWTAICTGSFFNWLLELENAAMGWDLRAKKVTLFDTGNQRFDVSTVDQVLRAIVATLTLPEETENTYIYVKSWTVTQNELLAVIETLSGQKFTVTHESIADVALRGEVNLAKGDLEAGYPQVVTAVGYGPWGFLDFGDKADHWVGLLGLARESLEETVKKVLQEKGLCT